MIRKILETKLNDKKFHKRDDHVYSKNNEIHRNLRKLDKRETNIVGCIQQKMNDHAQGSTPQGRYQQTGN